MESLTSVNLLFEKLKHNASLALWLVFGSFLMWLPASFVIASPANRTYLQTTTTSNVTRPDLLKQTAVLATRSKTSGIQDASLVLARAAHQQKFLPSRYFKLKPLEKILPPLLTLNRSNSRDPPLEKWLKMFA